MINYLKGVDNFNVIKSSYSAQLSSIDRDRQLDEKTSLMKEVLTLIGPLREEDKAIKERATQLSLEKKELKTKFQNINVESKNLLSLSCEKKEVIDGKELEVAKMLEEINTLESTPTITGESMEAFAIVCMKEA